MAASYLLCATPRTGSTMLCSLLTSTGVAGRPQSYFREPDVAEWARKFGTPTSPGGAVDYERFVADAVQYGTTDNGVFAARIMWGTIPAIVDGLRPRDDGRTDAQVIQDVMGPLRFVHLRRGDVVGQAVSWARAEQTGYWQRGDTTDGEPVFDLHQIDTIVETINSDNGAWESWFAAQSITPLEVFYEDLIDDADRTVRRILDWLGLGATPGWAPVTQHERQADDLNAQWVERYTAARR